MVLAVEEVIVVLAYDRDDRRAGYSGQRGVQLRETGPLTLHRKVERALLEWEEVRVGREVPSALGEDPQGYLLS